MPPELQQAILDYKMQFSNTMKRGDSMKVKPAKFKLKKDYKVPVQRGGCQLPPIHMRQACDQLLDELEEAGVIEPSPPDDSEFTSRAIFIAKNGDPTKIRLCIDYLRSGANDALVRTPHPQPTPEQLVSNIPAGMKHMAVMDVKQCNSTEKVKFGGCIVTREGVTQDPDRLLAVKLYSRPQSASDVRRFLGLCTSLSKYTNTLLRSTSHLRALTAMHAPFIWTDQHEQEFNFLREDLSQPKLLHHFKPGLQIGGDVDASDNGWGGIIYMYDRSISEEPTEGNFYPQQHPHHGRILARPKKKPAPRSRC